MSIAADAAIRTDERILVVEDDVATRSALADILEIEGYNVATVGNGREALEYAQDNPAPCLIILDLMMPEMDGWEFRARQKKHPKLAESPVFVLTASGRQATKGFDADMILHKPIDVDRLLSAIESFC
jgi:CheY-like chemotaxis protein